MNSYVNSRKISIFPRLPLEGNIDLTYRCNNDCLHCWLRIHPSSPRRNDELSTEEIKKLVTDARALGCRSWALSGGEPMLRPDFAEILEFIIERSMGYTLNTNGTLITPSIARLMKNRGAKMVALYGATAELHDRVTRNPGSFEATIQGCSYLREAGAGFTVQLIPMKENYHHYEAMKKLAKSLSPHFRIGAAWLYLSAARCSRKNREISAQRLHPRSIIKLDPPDMTIDMGKSLTCKSSSAHSAEEDSFFSKCINTGHDFHVDPYGFTSFCSFIKDPSLRYDLRRGTFAEFWEGFIPTLAGREKGGGEYDRNCRACDLREDCAWCPVYAYLEHGRYSAPIEYLCSIAKESRRYRENWQKNHRQFFSIGGMTVRVDSELPMNDKTFGPRFDPFRANGPGKDNLSIRQYFTIPDLQRIDRGRLIYKKPPWAIYEVGDTFVYFNIGSDGDIKKPLQVAVFNHEHSEAAIYHRHKKTFREGRLTSLTLLPTDQIMLARALAFREGLYIHAAGLAFSGRGFLFAGRSDAGKSTIVSMLKEYGKVLCDDRIILRNQEGSFIAYGTWSHGDIDIVSSESVPLKAILFLEKHHENCLIPLHDRMEVLRRLMECLIKPLLTADWWNRVIMLVENLALWIPCYILRFKIDGNSTSLHKIIGEIE